MNPTLQAALDYAARGWPVLPIYGVTAGHCNCGSLTCHSPGKHPVGRLAPNGLKDATTDPAVLEQWFPDGHNNNLATRTDHITVVDLDAPEVARDYESWCIDSEIGGFPYQETQSGGYQAFHLHYPELGPMTKIGGRPLDLRSGPGSYVVVPPSIGVKGAYSWINPPNGEALPPLPADFLRLIAAQRPINQLPAPILQKVREGIPGGSRNDTLYRLGVKSAGSGMDYHEILATLTTFNEQNCTPPLPLAEIMTLAESVSKSRAAQEASLRPPAPAALPPPADLPAIVSVRDLIDSNPERPPQVIHGILYKGSKCIYGGPSKANKTWVLMHAALAVANGSPWLGFPTTLGRVLYINFELRPFEIKDRFLAIADTLKLDIPADRLHVWNLRGKGRPLNALLPDLLKQCQSGTYDLIIPDPIYKTMVGRDENAAGEVGEVCAQIEAVAVQCDSAVMFGAHFAKGNASSKNAIDRISGSGVFARDPDAIITATPAEAEATFALEFTLRSFPPVPPVGISWHFPVMERDDLVDPERLKQVNTSHRPRENNSDTIINLIKKHGGMTYSELMEDSGMSPSTFKRRYKEARETPGVLLADGKLFFHQEKENF